MAVQGLYEGHLVFFLFMIYNLNREHAVHAKSVVEGHLTQSQRPLQVLTLYFVTWCGVVLDCVIILWYNSVVEFCSRNLWYNSGVELFGMVWSRGKASEGHSTKSSRLPRGQLVQTSNPASKQCSVQIHKYIVQIHK